MNKTSEEELSIKENDVDDIEEVCCFEAQNKQSTAKLCMNWMFGSIVIQLQHRKLKGSIATSIAIKVFCYV